MKFTAILCVWVIAMEAFAAAPVNVNAGRTSDLQTVHSASGQFVVAGPRTAFAGAGTSELRTNTVLVRLDPNLLAISCERIKLALLREFGMPDFWRGSIYAVINPAMTNNQPPVIGAKAFTGGWQYRVEVPPLIEKSKLARGLVQVLLLEIANRTAGLRSAEIPLWLTEGVTQHLLNSGETDLVVSDPRWNFNNVNVSWVARQAARRDPLNTVRERLLSHSAFTFAKLGEPVTDDWPEESWKTFQASAHLFVENLMMMNGGRAALIGMLFQLPHYLNWQSAFLNAFKARFPRMLDVEKWWAVVLVHFTGLDPAQAWSMDTASQKLDEMLHPPVLVSASARELPHRTRLTAQQIINEWDYLRQRVVLKGLSGQLFMMRIRTPPEMIGLVDEYRATIEAYIARRDKAGVARSLPGLPPMRADYLVRDVVKKLDELDQRRAVFGPAKGPATSALAKPAL